MEQMTPGMEVEADYLIVHKRGCELHIRSHQVAHDRGGQLQQATVCGGHRHLRQVRPKILHLGRLLSHQLQPRLTKLCSMQSKILWLMSWGLNIATPQNGWLADANCAKSEICTIHQMVYESNCTLRSMSWSMAMTPALRSYTSSLQFRASYHRCSPRVAK